MIRLFKPDLELLPDSLVHWKRKDTPLLRASPTIKILLVNETSYLQWQKQNVLEFFQNWLQEESSLKNILNQSPFASNLRQKIKDLGMADLTLALHLILNSTQTPFLHLKYPSGWLDQNDLRTFIDGLRHKNRLIFIEDWQSLNLSCTQTILPDRLIDQKISPLPAHIHDLPHYMQAPYLLLNAELKMSPAFGLQMGPSWFELESSMQIELLGLIKKPLILMLEARALQLSFKEKSGFIQTPILMQEMGQEPTALIEIAGRQIRVLLPKRSPVPWVYFQPDLQKAMLFHPDGERVWPK